MERETPADGQRIEGRIEIIENYNTFFYGDNKEILCQFDLMKRFVLLLLQKKRKNRPVVQPIDVR